MHSRSRQLVAWAVVAALLALAGCSPLPTSPEGTSSRPVRGNEPLGALPVVADSSADVPVLAALGGTALVRGYMVQVPPGALSRDATLHLAVHPSDQTLDVSFTPANVTLAMPLVLTAGLAGVATGDMGNWSVYSISGGTWTRVPGAKLVTYLEALQASIPGPGRYGIGSWQDLAPTTEIAETVADVGALFGGSVSCGTVAVDVPAGALRGNGTVDVRWNRITNVVNLEITPLSLNGFEQPVTLTMDASSLPVEQRSLAAVYWWNPDFERWEEVEGSVADPVTGRVRAPLQHFSQYTVGLQSKAGWGSLPGGRPVTE